MPIYEYECTSCHNVLEVFQRISEEPLCSCPACSGSLKKLVSVSSFQLKGSGWYADGYSSNSSNNNKPAGKTNGNGSSEISTKATTEKSSKPDSSKGSCDKAGCAATS